MNIREAKQEIIHTVRAYLCRDENGNFVIPVEKQRPILIMGPPGIGKTAIMEQVAQECGVNLVAYTITHHTRQSAIGLPFISKRNYGDTETSITEYTMSEIIASMYDRIEMSGVHEGILFLDEINCVSETLAPTMLQFLQYKMFGTHKVPDGFIIVTAGNPPEYNASVRDFDIVTLDRVRRIDVRADYEAWSSYALDTGVHGAVTAYLAIRKEHFYSMRAEPDGRRFVTARGWEDLSRVIKVHEALNLPVDHKLMRQFLQDDEIAESFATYYELWKKYRDVYDVEAILAGTPCAEADRDMLRKSPFDEKLSLISMVTTALTAEAKEACQAHDVQSLLRETVLTVKEISTNDTADFAETLSEAAETMRRELFRKERAGLIGAEEARMRQQVLEALREACAMLQTSGKAEGAFERMQDWFSAREERRLSEEARTGMRMDAAFSYLASVFGEGQEIVLFLTQLSAGHHTLRFVQETGNESYYRYNRLLLLDERREELTREVLSLHLTN